MILDCNGELFFATHTIETYLGFHQSDVIHQSVYELVHSEDREELQRQLGKYLILLTGLSLERVPRVPRYPLKCNNGYQGSNGYQVSILTEAFCPFSGYLNTVIWLRAWPWLRGKTDICTSKGAWESQRPLCRHLSFY